MALGPCIPTGICRLVGLSHALQQLPIVRFAALSTRNRRRPIFDFEQPAVPRRHASFLQETMPGQEMLCVLACCPRVSEIGETVDTLPPGQKVSAIRVCLNRDEGVHTPYYDVLVSTLQAGLRASHFSAFVGHGPLASATEPESPKVWLRIRILHNRNTSGRARSSATVFNQRSSSERGTGYTRSSRSCKVFASQEKGRCVHGDQRFSLSVLMLRCTHSH